MARFGTAERRHSGRLWRWIGRLFVLAILAVLAVVGYRVFGFTQSSDEFNLTKVTLEGLNVLTEEEVLIASRVSSGDSVLKLNRAKIKSRIESLAYVASAEVVIVFPDTLIIRINERTPFATLMVRNTPYEVDRSGVVLRRFQPGMKFITPILTNVAGVGFVEPGDVVQAPAFHAALDAWDAFRATDVAPELTLSEIAARSEDEIVMIFDEVPYEIRWGRGDFNAAAQRLDLLWNDRDGNLGCLEYLDLRFGEDIVCK